MGDDNSLGPKLLCEEIDDVINDIKKILADKKADKEAEKGDDYVKLIYDADKLRDKMLDMDLNQKNVDSEQRQSLKNYIKQVLGDILGDKNVNPSELTEQELRDKDLKPAVIEGCLMLKDIYIDLDSNKEVDPNALAKNLDEIIFDIRQGGEVVKEEIEAEEGDAEEKKQL